jgi:hypothetical protein
VDDPGAALIATLIVGLGFGASFLWLQRFESEGRRQRKRECAVAALQMGLQYSAADPFDTRGELAALPLFGTSGSSRFGNRWTRYGVRSIRDVMWGTWCSRDLRIFDLTRLTGEMGARPGAPRTGCVEEQEQR